MTETDEDFGDLFSDVTDLDLVRSFLADLHHNLSDKIARSRQLCDLELDLGRNGTLLPGGMASHVTWLEARSSFVHGNFVATILLCQGLMEHILAAYLHGPLLVDGIPNRIPFRETLRRCKDRDVISDRDVQDLCKLMELRNPLSHFRHISDDRNLTRRTIQTQDLTEEILRKDATFAINIAIRMLGKPAFRVD